MDIDQYSQYYSINSNIEESDKEKLEKFKLKLEEFKHIYTVEEAKELAKQMFNIENTVNYVKVGSAYCAIINKSDMLRVVLNDNEEVICHNFRKERQA